MNDPWNVSDWLVVDVIVINIVLIVRWSRVFVSLVWIGEGSSCRLGCGLGRTGAGFGIGLRIDGRIVGILCC